MWEAIKSTLKQYAGSKKAIATFCAVAAWVAAKIGWHVDSADLALAIGPLWLYVVGQALADHGKEAAKVNAAAAASFNESLKPAK